MSVVPVGIRDVPFPVFKLMCTYLDPQTLALSSRVCKVWHSAAKTELDAYKKNELFLRHKIYRHLTLMGQETKKEEIFEQKFREDFFSPAFDVSKQIITSHPEQYSLSSLSSIFKFFKSFLQFRETNYYLKFQKLIEEKSKHYNGLYILDFPKELLADRFFVHAVNQFDMSSFNFVYTNCSDFKDRLKTKISDVKSIRISRGACENSEALSCIKEVIASKQQLVHFTFFPVHTEFNSSFSVFENLYEKFRDLNQKYTISILCFYLNDTDAFWISKLIKESDKLYLCVIEIGDEFTSKGLTNKGFEYIAKALKERNSGLNFLLTFEEEKEISEGIHSIESLIGTKPNLNIKTIKQSKYDETSYQYFYQKFPD